MDLGGKAKRRTVGEEVDRPLLADDGHRTPVDGVGRVNRRTDVATGVGDVGSVEQNGGGHVLGRHVVSEPVQPLAPHPANVADQLILHRRHPLRMPHLVRRRHHPRSAPRQLDHPGDPEFVDLVAREPHHPGQYFVGVLT